MSEEHLGRHSPTAPSAAIRLVSTGAAYHLHRGYHPQLHHSREHRRQRRRAVPQPHGHPDGRGSQLPHRLQPFGLGGAGPDISGAFTSQGHTLIGDATGEQLGSPTVSTATSSARPPTPSTRRSVPWKTTAARPRLTLFWPAAGPSTRATTPAPWSPTRAAFRVRRTATSMASRWWTSARSSGSRRGE